MWIEPIIAVSIFGASLVIALVLNKLLFPLVLRITRRTRSDVDAKLVGAVRLPLTLVLVVLGAYLALTLPLDLSPEQQDIVNSVGGLLVILVVVVGVASLISYVAEWYTKNVAPRTESTLDQRLVPLFRRVAVGLVYGLGAVLTLDQLGINIGPLIAGLGLGGLAVALAIQPTLANLFAGTYVMTEGVVNPGDYIVLDGGVGGYVVDVGWRSTRIRTWGNNLVIIPNSKFAETIITNYQQPYPMVNVYLTCGVSYDSDLYQVGRVCQEVMDHVLETNDSAVKEYGSYFGFDNFGDSNINFWLFLQAKDRPASFIVRSDLVQRLHRRFQEEGILINYPVRSLKFPKEWGAEELVRLGIGPQQGLSAGLVEGGDGGGKGTEP